jgi:tRNA1(Val) A37 N6-methylase TrmN6
VDLVARALAAALGDAPGPRAAGWLARCAGWDGPLPAPSGEDLDQLCDEAWRARDRRDRRRLGQVFTPRAVARQVLLETPGADRDELLDPACGAGVFLVEAAALRLARGEPPERVLATVHGVDLDPRAVALARVLLGHEVVRRTPDAEDRVEGWPLPSVVCADATDPELPARFAGVRVVVGNPPYREAKGMPAAERDRLRRRFRVEGAFDLYLCFVQLALELVGPEGAVGFVLPNKLLVARYANELRRRLLVEGQLHAILDLSELDVFGRVGVYPVVVVLGPPKDRFKAAFAVRTAAELGRAPLEALEIPTDLVRRLADPPVWLTVPDAVVLGLLDRLAGSVPPARAQLEARSTCSFHAPGLRERYVGAEGLPYLGGKSFTRRNEVQPFRVDWQGYRIRYAEDELRALGNPLPPLARFLRPKLVLCQHARAPIAWFDAEGRFVTKDVYPIAVAAAGPTETAALAAVLNSRVFGVLYALMYRGIAIGSGYLHVLPAFLHTVPLPALGAVADRLADAVVALQAAPDRDAFERLDHQVAELYGLTDPEAEAVRRFADDRLGFAPDPFARR